MYDKEITIKLDASLGYQYFCDKEHPLASGSNHRVYYHRHVASLKEGRWLKTTEHVHHIDGDKINNNPDNLQILSPKEHARMHHPKKRRRLSLCSVCEGLIKFGNKSGRCAKCRAEHSRLLQLKRITRRRKKTLLCKGCAKPIFSGSTHNLCAVCYNLSIRRFDPTKEELERLVWEMPTVKVAKLFRVSDKAVEKRCKLLNIKKPPRGYWSKVRGRK